MNVIEVMKQALEALEELDGWDTATQGDLVVCTDAIEPLRAAIQQMENAEPAVLWNVGVSAFIPYGTPLYTHPAPAIPAWQPIETAPKDGTAILVSNGRSVWVAKYKLVFQSGYKPNSPWFCLMLNKDHIPEKFRAGAPTHWIPLPQPPKE